MSDDLCVNACIVTLDVSRTDNISQITGVVQYDARRARRPHCFYLSV
jgi:hypothetical protein